MVVCLENVCAQPQKGMKIVVCESPKRAWKLLIYESPKRAWKLFLQIWYDMANLLIESPPSPSAWFICWIFVQSLGMGDVENVLCWFCYSIVNMHGLWMCSMKPVYALFPLARGWSPWGLGWEVSLHGSHFVSLLSTGIHLKSLGSLVFIKFILA